MIDLGVRGEFDGASLLAFLGLRAVPGVEEVVGTTYRRVLDLPGGPMIAEVELGGGRARLRLRGGAEEDRPAAVAAVRDLVDADADPDAVGAVLGADPALAPLVGAGPGRRAPGTVDAAELAVRAVLGQQISVVAARTLAGRLAAGHGVAVTDPCGGLTRTFPAASALARVDHAELAMPRSRARTLTGLGTALASGDLVLRRGEDPGAARAALLALPGIGPWTADYVAMRALGDRDAFPATDLGVRHAARALGLPDDPRGLTARAEAWRPYRAYAVHHLWATLG